MRDRKTCLLRLLLVLRRRGITAHRAGHQANIYAAVLCASCLRRVLSYRLILTQSNHINLVCRQIVLLSQVLNHGRCTALAEHIVVLGAASGIGATNHLDDVLLGVGNVLGELIQGLLSLLAQVSLVKAEMHCYLGDRAVVVQIGHGLGEGIYAGGSTAGYGSGFLSLLS